MCMDAQVPWSPWMDENGLSLLKFYGGPTGLLAT